MDRSHSGNSREDIAEMLEQASILTTRHITDQAPLSLTAALTLSRLNKEGPIRLTTLAAAEGIAQPSMTQLIQRLERQGLATRINDPEDGRVTLVNITNAGRELMDDRRRDRRDRLAELLNGLSSEDEASLILAANVALPIIRRLVQNATNPAHSQTAKIA
jgi:DNA-binding MarR family transcriptional regulator